MRDAHRMKEKFDVSLDNRQIVSLLIAGIVVLGAVFVLGVVVGKKLAGDAQTASAPDLLSALDANAQALQAVQKEPHLTFQDELTRKAAAEPVAQPKPAPVKPAAEKPAPKPPEPVKTAALAPTPDPDTGELPPEEPTEEPVAAAKPPAEKPAPAPEKPAATEKPAAVAVKPATVSGKVEAAPVPTRTTQKEGGGLKEAIARAAAQPPDSAVKGGAFTLQLSAFQDKQEADRFVARLRDRGYAPYIVSAEVVGKGTWYRVRMGTFASKDAAARYLSDFKRETQLDAFVAGTN
ncbi:adventurous gliding motility protein AgmI [Myxococcus stipitatus DSM 14675]|uniref:Adventurous gliding motility protein AgmI n=1 Tax=Myxococcus stipitatus (strain DSM 14675 / JCM 12634 / Mx s8) TaxID=1278073 RepID=L7UD04_MYXSD|nr:SPOR domain-containing protein [Myxococcus stipitatus]AGC45765.1 adventurous gliding motility protein AgmI [Myxococcus stipitatus DSM 14675]